MAENTITGRAKKHDGTAIDYVSIFNWNDGACIAQITPNAAGIWNYQYLTNLKVGITYIADGCEPVTHGAYNFIAAWTPLKLKPKLYMDTNSAIWSGSVGSNITAWQDLSGEQSNFLPMGTVIKASDGALSMPLGNNYLYNSTTKTRSILSGVGKAWVFMVVKPTVTDTLFLQVTDTSSETSQVRLGLMYVEGKFLSISSKDSRSNSNDNFLSNPYPVNEYHMILLEHEWSTGRLAWHINGTLDKEVANHLQPSSIGTTNATAANNSVFIGQYAKSGTTRPHNQKALIVKTDDNLTQDTIDKLFGYAAHKHGLTAKLPANHPYKNNAPT